VGGIRAYAKRRRNCGEEDVIGDFAGDAEA
jgi:hypothetical protein